MVKSTLYNHYLIRICSLAVDMNNANKVSLYCRCLESINLNVDYVQRYFSGKEQSLTVPRVLLWPTSFVQNTEMLPVECSVVD